MSDIDIFENEDELMHYGVKRRSGRYPWGSGKDPYQHSGDFLSRVEELKSQGKSEKDIADEIGLSTTDLRMQIRVANHERRALLRDRAMSLREDGYSLDQIAKEMGYANDSSIRSLLNENTAINKNKAKVTAEILKEQIKKKGMLDVGVGVEKDLGVTDNTLKEALFILETEGYNVYGVGVRNVTDPKKQTTTEVLADKNLTYGYAYNNLDKIGTVTEYHSVDGGESFDSIKYPSSISSDRVSIRYADQGGLSKDGVIEIRRGVKDLDLGESHYAQVRIMVDDTHYLKGMAMYSDDIPEGYDIVFNTNKNSSVAKMDVLKEKKNDPDNPFGALIKAKGQSYYPDPNGKYTDPLTGEKVSLGAINKLKEECDWDTMSKNLSQQFLSKQPMKLISKQLDFTYEGYEDQFHDILEYTNPAVKQKELIDFADQCDSAAVHLKAAALPRQRTHVILPIDKLSETEVYAPNYENGEQLALIRFPHGGTFEIPILTVNNKNKSAIDILGPDITDAIGINSKVAERLSGADFDGDTVVTIPLSDKVKIKSTKALEGLKGFDAKTEYASEKRKEIDPKTGKEVIRYFNKYGDEFKPMPEKMKGKQMGMVSNLITDMTLKGAGEDEIARAVRHSEVVIDAVKHKLDYKLSEKENGIQELKEKWQRRVDDNGKEHVGGASTLLSMRKQEVAINERKGSPRIDKDTGEYIWKESGRTYVDPKTGEVTVAKTKISRMANTKDARTLSSGTIQEEAYADYANKMKALANEARKAAMATPNLQRNASAAKVYENEVNALEAKLNIAIKRAPMERLAQRKATVEVNAKMQADPSLKLKENKSALKKVRQLAITKARASFGKSSKESKIIFTDREWEAIQAGALSHSKVSQLLRYADADKLKERVSPIDKKLMSTAKIQKAKSMRVSGYTNAEIAEALGVSVTTLQNSLNTKK